MLNVRLYLPSVILLSWAICWAAGLRGDAVIVAGLTSTAVGVLVAELERRRLRALIATPGADPHPELQNTRALIRDLWLIVISALVVWAAIATQDLVDDLASTRRAAVLDRCVNDQAQDNVLRALILAALARPDADETEADQAKDRADSEELLKPLGGLEPTKAELRARCERVVESVVP